MRVTKRDLQSVTRGGLAFTIPKGSETLPIPWDEARVWIAPATFDSNSIEHHNAEYYGVAIFIEETEESDT